MKVYIYTLDCPITKHPRYVGRTRKSDLRLRLWEHCCVSKSNHNVYKKNWIKKLKSQNLSPTISLVEELECTWEESHETEKYWIKQFGAWGFKLVNLEDKGASGYRDFTKYTGSHDSPILQYSSKGDFIQEFKSIREAKRQTNIRATTIEKVLWRICNTAGGFQWRYKIDNYPIKINECIRKHPYLSRQIINQISLSGEVLKYWSNMKEVKEFMNKSAVEVRKVINNRLVFEDCYWEYKEF